MINHASDEDEAANNGSNCHTVNEYNKDKDKGRRYTKNRGRTTNDIKQDELFGIEL